MLIFFVKRIGGQIDTVFTDTGGGPASVAGMTTWKYLMMAGLMTLCVPAEESKETARPRDKHEFWVNQTRYLVEDYAECGNSPDTPWDFTKNDVPPVTFKQAQDLMDAELKRVFPGVVFAGWEMSLHVPDEKHAYYIRRFCQPDTYNHFLLGVDMKGRVTPIEKAEPQKKK